LQFVKTPLHKTWLIRPDKKSDERGYFARTFCTTEFKNTGIDFQIVQANTGFTKYRGTVRGLHYQVKPHREAKLIRCIRGAIYDVMVDLRSDSPTYLRWYGIEIFEGDDTMILVPEGLAHGYQTLQNNTEIFYLVNQFYTPRAEKGIRWDDPAFNIEWPIKDNVIISDKDRNWPDFHK
jgi:dTDP-4-dehydrorhamnose 3,5-epimerase